MAHKAKNVYSLVFTPPGVQFRAWAVSVFGMLIAMKSTLTELEGVVSL